LEQSWSNSHIFLSDQALLDFQHRSLHGYNFVVAHHRESGKFHGVLGLISPSFYVDREISVGDDLWLAIWKVDKELSESSSLGLDLLDYAVQKFEPKSVSAIGINESVALLYRIMGFKVAKMNHWFVPNFEARKSKLITGAYSRVIPSQDSRVSARWLGIESEHTIASFFSGQSGRANPNYITARYLKHPVFQYRLVGIFEGNQSILALAVGREVSIGGAKAFRLTELFVSEGNNPRFGAVFQPFMLSNGYDYIDFVEFGFDEGVIKSLGFMKSRDDLYVPHLFDPFVAERREVTIAYKSEGPFVCTKGDSDLDRPNVGGFSE